MLRAYAIGLFGAVVVILVVAGIWFVTQPKQEPGLVWGGTVYSSKAEFKGYLREKGLSYKLWLARNPGAAPWEPDVGSEATPVPASGSSRVALSPAPKAGRDSATELPLTTLGILAAAALLLLLRLPRPALPRLARESMTISRPRPVGSTGRVQRTSVALRPAIRRLGVAGAGATRRVPLRTERLVSALRADARLVRGSLYRWNHRGGGVIVFLLITIIAAGALGVFIALLISA